MLVLGLLVLTAALVVGSVAVASNTGSAHQLPEGFSLFGYHIHGSVGKLFFAGMVVGAVGMIGLVMVVAGLRRNAALRRELAKVRREDRAARLAEPTAPAVASRPTASRPFEPRPLEPREPRALEPQFPAIPAPRPSAGIGASSSPRMTPPGSSGSHRRSAGSGSRGGDDIPSSTSSSSSSKSSSTSASASAQRRSLRNLRPGPSKAPEDRPGDRDITSAG